MTEEKQRSVRKTLVGIVASDKMDKTIVVEVQRTVMHPVFKKYIRRRTKYQAHDEQNEAGIGDKVEIAETRPISKKKAFRLVKILAKARIPAATPKVEETTPEVEGD